MTAMEDWEDVTVDADIEFPNETMSVLGLIREFDGKVIALFPKGTENKPVEYSDAKKVVDKMPGVHIGMVAVTATYTVLGKAKIFRKRQST